MKKVLGGFAIIFLALIAILVYRAETLFENRQLEPAAGLGEVNISRELAIQRFAGALRFATVSNDDRNDFDAAAFTGLHDYLEQAYPLVHHNTERTVINGYSLVFHLPGSDASLKPVLFMGHMDVVPVQDDTLPDWTHPPFAGTVDDTTIWGRGSVDDKLTVIALLEAMEQLLAEGARPRRSIFLAFGHDEEVGGQDGAARVAEHFGQQGIEFDFVMDEGGAISHGMVGNIEEPVAIIGVSEKGYVNLVLTVKARGGHSSQPPAQTALGILSRAIVKVEDNPFPARLDYIYPTFEAIGYWMPFSRRLAMSNLWLFGSLVRNAMVENQDDAPGVRTTTAATMASGSPKSNILPTRAQAVINFRILPGETVESVTERVVQLIDDDRVEVTAEYGMNPSKVSPTNSRGFEMISRTIRGLDNEVLVAPYMVRGGTDAKYFYELSPNIYRFMMIRVTPETIRFIHGIDERIKREDFLLAIRFNYHLMRQAMEG